MTAENRRAFFISMTGNLLSTQLTEIHQFIRGWHSETTSGM
jgi:hypothetical protein